jgi:hypothetical protein
MLSRKTLTSVCALGALTMGMVAVPAHARTTEDVISAHKASQAVMVTDLQVRDGVISGKVVNKSSSTLRDVKLMVDHAWLWKNEWHPGANSPSRTDFYTLPQAIPPHGTVAFRDHINPPLPQRTDGRFETIVKVMDFTEVGTQQALR